MRKTLLTVALGAACTFASFAQDETMSEDSSEGLKSKKGVSILPEAGDWSIGINATGVVNYFGNALSGVNDNNNGATAFQFMEDQRIMGKYFVDKNTAYRGILRIGLESVTDKETVVDATDPDEFVENKETASETNIAIGAGLEKRRGSGRVQGFYGAQALIGLSSSSTSNEYGNSLEDIGTIGNTRTLETKNGSMFMFELGAFIGVEYFFAPKMAIGGEFGWGLSLETERKQTVTTETFDGTDTEETETEQFIDGREGSVRLDTGNMNGNLFINFYF